MSWGILGCPGVIRLTRPRARFHGASFEIVKSTKLAISVRQKQNDNSASSSSLSIKEGLLSELDKVYMQLQ